MTGTGIKGQPPFASRHIGPQPDEVAHMLATVGVASTEALLAEAVPAGILLPQAPTLPPCEFAAADGPLSEPGALAALQGLVAGPPAPKPMIGLGYHGTVMPEPIRRLLLENPSWYTAYTPYQPEISQGRLEMLLNFQTMVADLCGLPMANASLLDEATAAAEALALFARADKDGRRRFCVDADIHPQTLDVLHTRAGPLGIELVVGAPADFDPAGACGALMCLPGSSGTLTDIEPHVRRLADADVPTAACADLLALCLVRAPGAMGAAVVVGSCQRFGLPMGAGGPHAGFMAFDPRYARLVPGRLVGVSRDSAGRPALRLALQTREQHIRRARATSNICTAQVLPAVLAAAFAVYHGPAGLRALARHAHDQARTIAGAAQAAGLQLASTAFFDTLRIAVDDVPATLARGREHGVALLGCDGAVGVSCDETTSAADVAAVLAALDVPPGATPVGGLPGGMGRAGAILPQPVFRRHHSEHAFMRYLQGLVRKDIALDRSMIPLGSCTMKLNAATELAALSWPGFGNIHPFAPAADRAPLEAVAADLGAMLMALTGFAGVSLQPNAGSQGEYAGLLAIRGHHQANGDPDRDVCLVPTSAHGTNPASAALAGMQVVEVAIDAEGEIDLADLEAKASAHAGRVAALMVTYPSTCGIYGPRITEACALVHRHGGQVYLDGANLNAMVGVAQPGVFGADVMHINLHKTFCIPHGGGGPGMGPIVCGPHLVPHLPGHAHGRPGAPSGAVSAAPLGSGLLLLISWAYLRMMGAPALREATAVAVLAANYMACRLGTAYDLAFTGNNGRVAHEFILDARGFRKGAGITVEDMAKRLIDFGFHAPTVSFPRPGQ